MHGFSLTRKINFYLLKNRLFSGDLGSGFLSALIRAPACAGETTLESRGFVVIPAKAGIRDQEKNKSLLPAPSPPLPTPFFKARRNPAPGGTDGSLRNHHSLKGFSAPAL
jgi:hypothetical protein